MSQFVWVIESGEYEDRSVDGVAASVEAAVRFIKKRFGDPYIVEWEPLKKCEEEEFALIGHFEDVPNFSIKHRGIYNITRYELAEDPPPSSGAAAD